MIGFAWGYEGIAESPTEDSRGKWRGKGYSVGDDRCQRWGEKGELVGLASWTRGESVCGAE